jgi:hypothetical protein
MEPFFAESCFASSLESLELALGAQIYFDGPDPLFMLRALPGLRSLSLRAVDDYRPSGFLLRGSALDDIRGLWRLQSLTLDKVQALSFEGLCPAGLLRLSVRGWAALTSLAGLPPGLQHLTVRDCALFQDVSALLALERLVTLVFLDCPLVRPDDLGATGTRAAWTA